ncbi:MAG TPA: hypothetical protein VFK05_00580 [Polyangiaceae bacterium]|nr:hypothetical protein [Polyangiaceae bacterium]
MSWRRVLSGFGIMLTLSACAEQEPRATAPATQAPPGAPENKQQEAARARLRAVIRDQSFLEQMPMAERASTIVEPFLGHMVILYLVDDRGAARGAQAADLAESGVTHEALRAVVEWNLAHVLPGPLSCTSHLLTEPAHHNYYESSRLLLDKQWADLARLGGTVVVAVPSNDTLFVACNPTPDTIQKLSVAVQNTYPRAARPVSPSLLTWSADGWRELPSPH